MQRSQPRPVSGHFHTLEHTLTPRFLSPLGKNGQRLRASKSSGWETSRRAFPSAERTPGSRPSAGSASWCRQHEAFVGRRWSGGRRSLRPPLGLKRSAWFETLRCWREPVYQLTRLRWRHLWDVENHPNGMSSWRAKARQSSVPVVQCHRTHREPGASL